MKKDHLRIQVILPGLQLEEALQEADRYDDGLEESSTMLLTSATVT